MVYGGWIGWSKLKRFIEGVGGRRPDAPKGQRVAADGWRVCRLVAGMGSVCGAFCLWKNSDWK